MDAIEDVRIRLSEKQDLTNADIEDTSGEQRRSLFLMNRKYQFSKTKPIELMNIFNLMKSRRLLDVALLENILMSLSRLDSNKNAIAVFDEYFSWTKDGSLSVSSDKFFLNYALSCYANGLHEAARHVEGVLLISSAATKEDFFCGRLCAVIDQNHLSDVKDMQLKLKPCREELLVFYKQIQLFPIDQINLVIRCLAKYRMTEDIFNLFDALRSARVKVVPLYFFPSRHDESTCFSLTCS